jgi:chromosome segregation ATPase
MGQHEGAVRAAMDRLFAGQAVHSDGRLTVKNLAVEAAIPRSTLYRAEPELIREFERRLQHSQDTSPPVGGRLAARVARLEAKLAATERRAAGYRDDLEQERRRSRGLANQIALLDAERRKLEDQLTTSKPIASLDAHRRRWQTQGES